MATIVKFFGAWLSGTIVVYAIGAIAQSIFILLELNEAGAALTVATWGQVIIHDLINMAFGGKYISYGTNLMAAFIVAMPAAILAARIVRLPLMLVAAVAGLVAVVTMIEIVNYNAASTLFAGTRGWAGMLAQCLAGAAGGAVFAKVFTSPLVPTSMVQEQGA